MHSKREILNSLWKIMKFSFIQLLFITLTFSFLRANNAFSQEILDRQFSVALENVSMKEALEKIEQKGNVYFSYRTQLIKKIKEVSLAANDRRLEEILEELFLSHNISFKVYSNNNIVLKKSSSLGLIDNVKEIRTLTGTIIDAKTAEPLIGANVLIKGTSSGTITDYDGTFSLEVPDDATTLIITYTGYTDQEIEIGSQTNFNIALSPGTLLEEVVVVGYGTVKREDATGAISTLNPDDFNQGVISSPEQLLQGRSAGVQITSDGGEPGGGVNVRIRGTSSVRSGNGPLFVVDGVVLSGGAVSPAGQNAGSSDAGSGNTSPKNPLNFINPNDIASIDILKDASATAIYGSRGANGVIIITTKKGRTGRGALTYSTGVSVSTITNKLDILDAPAFLDAATALGAERSNIDFGAQTDWQDVIFRTAYSQNHNLSYGGGGEGSTYRFSLGMTDQEGIVEDSGLKRYSGSMSTNYDLFDGKLSIQTKLSVANVLDENPQISNDAGFTGDLLSGAWRANPTRPIFESDGVTYAQPDQTERNPGAIIAFTKDNTNTLRTLGSISANYNIASGLDYKFNLGVDRTNSERRSAISSDLNVPRFRDGGGAATFSEVLSYSKLLEHTLSYSKEVKKHQINLLAGYSYQDFNNQSRFLTATNFQSTDLEVMLNNLEAANFSGSTETARGGSAKTKDELQSYFGRANVILSDKYIVTATLRADGSSKFGRNNRYGYFPSAAFAWKLSDEDFIPKSVDNLKLRLGWGVTGNQEFPGGNNIFRQRYNGSNQLVDASFANPDLKWETTTQSNLGIDYAFLDYRLTGSIDFYAKSTEDLLFRTISAQPATQPFVWENLNGKVKNKGVEFGIEGVLIDKKDLNWTSFFNISFNKNEVEGIGRTINTGAISGQGLTGAFAQVITDGQPLYTYFLRDFQGFDDNGINVFGGTGDPTLTGKSPLPDFTYGFTNSLTYGNWNLSVFITGQQGGYVYNNNANALFIAGSIAAAKNVTSNIAGNGESRFNSNDPSTRFLEDASFLRLQNLNIGYTFDTKDSEIFSDLRLSFVGQNLLTITDYSGQDPEVNVDKSINGVPSFGIDYSAYPRARSFNLNLTVSLK